MAHFKLGIFWKFNFMTLEVEHKLNNRFFFSYILQFDLLITFNGQKKSFFIPWELKNLNCEKVFW